MSCDKGEGDGKGIWLGEGVAEDGVADGLRVGLGVGVGEGACVGLGVGDGCGAVTFTVMVLFDWLFVAPCSSKARRVSEYAPGLRLAASKL